MLLKAFFVFGLTSILAMEGRPRRTPQVTFGESTRVSYMYNPSNGSTTQIPLTAQSRVQPSSRSRATRPRTNRTRSERRRDRERDLDQMDNGKKLDREKEPRVIKNPIGQGWMDFRFGTVNEEASVSFRISRQKHHVRVRITDLYLNGDRFAIINAANNVKIYETPLVDSDPRRRSVTDPSEAFKWQSVWSRGEFILPPNERIHLIIKPLSSPYDGGTASIRFDFVEIDENAVTLSRSSAQKPLCSGYGGYVVTRMKVNAKKQVGLCQAIGLLPTNFEADDDNEVESIVRTAGLCLPREELAWIGALNGDAKEGRLAITLTKDKRLRIDKSDPTEPHSVICRVQD